MARKKIQKELQAKSRTLRLYDWEVQKVKDFIKSLRKVKYKVVDAVTKKSYGVYTNKEIAIKIASKHNNTKIEEIKQCM